MFQLTITITSLTIVFISGITIGDSPLNVIQLLWINMVMDTLAAISLATEPPHPTQLKKKRLNKNEKVFLPEMWRQILGISAYQLLVLIVFLYAFPAIFGLRYNMFTTTEYLTSSDNPALGGQPTNKAYHFTFLFNTFMMMNLFNQINCRRLGAQDFNVFERFFNNWLFLLILAAEFGIQYLIVELGAASQTFGQIFMTAPQTFQMWLTSILLGASVLGVSAALKATPIQWLEKIRVPLREEKVEEEEDVLSKTFAKISGSLARSETERLLD